MMAKMLVSLSRMVKMIVNSAGSMILLVQKYPEVDNDTDDDDGEDDDDDGVFF